MAKEIYIIAPDTFYDDDKQLFYTYIGLDNTDKTLLLTVWGKNEALCRVRAKMIKKLFELNEVS